ncbi:MAG: hypothetical protein GX162_10650 [Firmicutes bacterium]|jgi:hypothetical protein|nr:hypothetical protein [Bacillota bacterium]
MQQPTPGSGWCERLELVLEGGGQLPGAIRVVDIRDQVLSCAADRQDDKALVRGQLQVFVYYNIAGNERIQGQSAEIPWHCEVPIPPNVQGPIDARVVDIRHDHAYDPGTERLRHTMHLTFEVWSIDAQPTDTSVSPRTGHRPDADQAPEPVEDFSLELEPSDLSDDDDPPDDSCDEEDDTPPPADDSAPEPESSFEGEEPLPLDEDEPRPIDLVVTDTATAERLDELESHIHRIRSELSSLQEGLECLREELRSVRESIPVFQEVEKEIGEGQPAQSQVAEEKEGQEEKKPDKEESRDEMPQPLPKREAEILIWRPFPKESPR